MSTFKSIDIEVFHTPSGEPTCATDFSKGKVCKFLYSRKFGLQGFCILLDQKIEYGSGYTSPSHDCPLHQE